jgi:hypothetical protein
LPQKLGYPTKEDNDDPVRVQPSQEIARGFESKVPSTSSASSGEVVDGGLDRRALVRIVDAVATILEELLDASGLALDALQTVRYVPSSLIRKIACTRHYPVRGQRTHRTGIHNVTATSTQTVTALACFGAATLCDCDAHSRRIEPVMAHVPDRDDLAAHI